MLGYYKVVCLVCCGIRPGFGLYWVDIKCCVKYIVVVLDLVWTYTGLIYILYRRTPIIILLQGIFEKSEIFDWFRLLFYVIAF